jgi:hypothetical protein
LATNGRKEDGQFEAINLVGISTFDVLTMNLKRRKGKVPFEATANGLINLLSWEDQKV